MFKAKFSNRFVSAVLASFLMFSALLYAGSARAAWADAPAGGQEDKHVAEVSFGLNLYGFGKRVAGVNITTQTDHVSLQYWQVFTSDKDNQDWKKITDGNFTNEAKYRLKIFFKPKDGYDFDKLTADKITLQGHGKAVEYGDHNGDKFALFDLTAIPPNHTLTFSTGDGSAIDPVTRPENTVIDLAGYLPTKDGFTFDGWYIDEGLTNKVESVTLGQDMTVYAKWMEKQNPMPNTPEKPGTPDTPDKPGQPDTPGKPGTPDTPGTQNPGDSTTPPVVPPTKPQDSSSNAMKPENNDQKEKKNSGNAASVKSPKSSLSNTGSTYASLLGAALAMTALGAGVLMRVRLKRKF